MSIAHRSIVSVSWNITSNLAKSAVLLVRLILLARLLPVEIFGVYGYAGAIVMLSLVFANFGMDGAFIHRSEETQDEEGAATTHFTLKFIFTILWTLVLILGALVLTSGLQRTAIILLTLATAGNQLTQTPKLILIRRVVHRRLAVVNITNAVLTTLVAVTLAWKGIALWALLSTDFAAMALNLVAFYAWKPVWRPHFTWHGSRIRYYLKFGGQNFLADLILNALDQVDDLWTGFYLGSTALGFYSRAYTFATYPRQVFALPVNTVSTGTYAELKDQRLSLSRSFFRINASLVRINFLFAGLLALVAPEFIRLVLGVKWLPMLTTFRLMLAFTLLDPIRLTIGNLFIAVGKPDFLVRIRAVQFIILVLGLFGLGSMAGIAGIALAVDLMLVAGITLSFLWARSYVDFSLKQLFLIPTAALVIAMLMARLSITLPGILGSDWRTGILKSVVFMVIYAGILLFFERAQIDKMRTYLISELSARTR